MEGYEDVAGGLKPLETQRLLSRTKEQRQFSAVGRFCQGIGETD